MKYIFFFILFLLLLVLQLTLLPRLNLFSIFPNILLAVILVLALAPDEKTALLWAFVAGFLLDIFSSLPFGIYILSFILLVWLIRVAGKNIFKVTDFSGQIFLVIFASFVYSIFVFGLIKIFYWLRAGTEFYFWSGFFRVGLLEICLNIIATIIVLIAVRKLHGLSAKF